MEFPSIHTLYHKYNKKAILQGLESLLSLHYTTDKLNTKTKTITKLFNHFDIFALQRHKGLSKKHKQNG